MEIVTFPSVLEAFRINSSPLLSCLGLSLESRQICALAGYNCLACYVVENLVQRKDVKEVDSQWKTEIYSTSKSSELGHCVPLSLLMGSQSIHL